MTLSEAKEIAYRPENYPTDTLNTALTTIEKTKNLQQTWIGRGRFERRIASLKNEIEQRGSK